MTQLRRDEIIRLRESFLPYEEAAKLQEELISIYQKEYKPKHSKNVYYDLIVNNYVSEIKERNPQEVNYADKVFCCFSVPSQHVYGFTKEHCLDQVYDAVKRKEKRIKEYSKLQTLEELVESNIEINPEKMYKTKEKWTYADSCCSRSGSIILEMRSIGLEKWNENKFKELFNHNGLKL